MTKLFVVDTSTLISAHLLPESKPRKAYDLVCSLGVTVFSISTFHEFGTTFTREKFERYQSLDNRLLMIKFIEQRSHFKEISIRLKVCRDPTDDMFLELALGCGASAIITSDPDLLELNPFREIPILSPADFLKLH
jgi:uncharacterized protein